MPSDLLFLELDEVLEIHRTRIELYGGSYGVRDQGLLESAIAQPKQQFGGEYLHADLAEMAAAYLFSLCKNHAFVDGNKRVAAGAAIVFLKLNGARLRVDEQGLGDLTLAVADGRATKPQAAEFFRAHFEHDE